MNALVRIAAASLLAAVAAAPVSVSASGVWSPEAVFETTGMPEPGRLNAHLKGEVGVLRPEYSLLYLWAAQRALRGHPLGANEVALARTAQLGIGGDEDGFSVWRQAREVFAKEAGAPAAGEIEVFGTLSDGEVDNGFLNCQDDAFLTAAKRLKVQRARDGANAAPVNAWVRDWVLGQDAVFSNCAIVGGRDPDPAPADAPEWLRADRAYQRAAALFYRGESERAAAAFAAIAADPASPWRDTAAYLVPRTWVREALYFTDAGAPREAALGKAAAAVTAALADPNLRARKEALGRLQRRIALLRDPRAAFAAAIERLEQDDADDDFLQDLEEVRFLRDDVPPEQALASWLLNVKDDAAVAYPVALARWRETRRADWLLATLHHAPVRDAGTDEALAAAAALPANAPGALPIQFERARLLTARRDAAAIPLLDAMLARTDLARSDRNALQRVRFAAAPTLAEAMRFATAQYIGIAFESERDLWPTWAIVPDPEPTAPAAAKPPPPKEEGQSQDEDDYDWVNESWPALNAMEGQPALLPDAAAQLDRWLPVRALLEIATASDAAPGVDGAGALPARVRQEIAGTAWLRAWLLGRRAEFAAATPLFVALYPEQAALLAAGADVRPAPRAPVSAGALRAAIVVLRLPGLRPHVEAGVGRAMRPDQIGLLAAWRWWNAGEEEFDPAVAVDRPAFVDDAMATAADADQRALATIGDATHELGELVLRYAVANPKDPNVPEALHLVVRATRFGTADSALSRRAYTLLHQRYATSDWAKRTPYFF